MSENSEVDRQGRQQQNPRSGGKQIRAYREVAGELAKVPGLVFEAGPERVRIEPVDAEGFPIELTVGPESYTLCFADWHQEFLDEEAALDCLFFGLCEDCRLEVASRSGHDYRWTMQALKGERWVPHSTTFGFDLRFWRAAEVRYLRNRILTPPAATP